MSENEGVGPDVVAEPSFEPEAPAAPVIAADFEKDWEATYTEDSPEVGEDGVPPEAEASETPEAEEDNIFDEMLKEELGEEESDEEDEDEDVEESDEVEQTPEEPKKEGRAQKRIRQLNKKAKEAEAYSEQIRGEATQIQAKARQMRDKFAQTWEAGKQENQALRTQLAVLNAKLEARLPADEDDEYSTEAPAAKIKAQLAKELRESEVAPMQRKLAALEKAEADRRAYQQNLEKQQKINEGATRLRERTAEALNTQLLSGLDESVMDANERKFMNAAMIGFQANKISPEEAAVVMKRIMTKWSAATMKTRSKARNAALTKAAKVPQKAGNSPVSPNVAEPSRETLEANNLTRPQWKLMGSPPLE